MFNFSTAPAILLDADEELTADVDEPPEHSPISPLHKTDDDAKLGAGFLKTPRAPLDRKESLLTRALRTPGDGRNSDGTEDSTPPRALSNASILSNESTVSTAELCSDHSSPPRTVSPSPPLPPQYNRLPSPPPTKLEGDKTIVKAPLTPVAETPETKVEANLGRKRCITFACNKQPVEQPVTKPIEKAAEPSKIVTPVTSDFPVRKCAIKFACPTRQASSEAAPGLDPRKRPDVTRSATLPHIASASMTPTPEPVSKGPNKKDDAAIPERPSLSDKTPRKSVPIPKVQRTKEPENPEALRFHEFASSNDEDDAWVNENIKHKSKITINDCMKKENAIRQIGAEAEEEAEQEEAEAAEREEEYEDEEQEDDFAPSDASSDDGNESDNEEGFAESDDESEAGSDDIFWAPTSTAATSAEHLDQFRPPTSRRDSDLSIDSVDSDNLVLHHPVPHRPHQKRRPTRPIKMRPGTPDLPDSTDFVCGTLDEDRPLEAAYISCMEQKKRAKLVPIPQDIDPSFPTTDPEDEDEELDEEDEIGDDNVGEPEWLNNQFDEVSNETYRGRRRRSTYTKKSPVPSPRRVHSPAPKFKSHRSPPPPRRLFGNSPRRMRSPPPGIRIRSPPGTRRPSLDSTPNDRTPVGITITRLAQRPNTTQTASLPHTPNPYFRNYRSKRRDGPSVISMTPTSEQAEEGQDRHVRGAVDIVIGLEKKRQKRKEKFWRQHCRKAAKEQAERKPIPGKGVERMKELGLDRAERNRGYGAGQTAQLVLSL